MPLNSLVSQAGLKLGPLLLETLVKHYFERILKERGSGVTQLSQDELLYDEAFHIIKTFLEAATKHTVEELQEFSNTRTPSPPWTHVVRLIVPMSCCDDAATYLIQALGGEEVTKRVVGGTKWWQVRGVRGVDAEWITAKKDWREAKRRYKEQQKKRSSDVGNGSGDVNEAQSTGDQDGPAVYEPEMDAMRCVLYAHGGGYYFGSIDQERYSLERYARKINGRVFAINYRLAPQYPFPCALQDFLAAYLFLIRPPDGASHRPVDPAHIVVAGDSAGGGLSIALLQVIRDTGLPMPAGAFLISPWCDLTHSFPSVHTNSATDVLPPYGLSFHKPSTLWPAPPKELATEVQNSIRDRVRQVAHWGKLPGDPGAASRAMEESAAGIQEHEFLDVPTGRTLHLGSTASLPQPSIFRDQTVTLRTKSGEVYKIEDQIQLYTPNYLLTHPLVSPVLSYLGGLPPLLVIASEKEVIRDEIIHFAHKAAHPDKYHVKDEVRKMYPALNGIESRVGPTKVHLQVWDDAAHTLPTLFAFTTPAKYCYRGIATFCKYVTGMLPRPSKIRSDPSTLSLLAPGGEDTPSPPGTPLLNEFGAHEMTMSPTSASNSNLSASLPAAKPKIARPSTSGGHSESASKAKRSVRRTMTMSVTRASGFFHRGSSHLTSGSGSGGDVLREPSESSDVAGPRFGGIQTSKSSSARMAGEPAVYENGMDVMIRERVSTNGTVRPMEPEEELPALRYPEELIGVLSELAVRRYFDGREKFSKKFAKVGKSIEKKRQHNLAQAQNDTVRNMSQLQTYLVQEREERPYTPKGIQEGLISSGSWPWAWALDMGEEPPPSSIVARRDTDEARRLARIADQAFLMDEHAMSGNNLWTMIVDFLSKTPDRHRHDKPEREHVDNHATNNADGGNKTLGKSKSRFARLIAERRKESKSGNE